MVLPGTDRADDERLELDQWKMLLYGPEKRIYMLADCVTPDGYTVDETGAWCVRGAVQTIGKK